MQGSAVEVSNRIGVKMVLAPVQAVVWRNVHCDAVRLDILLNSTEAE